MIGGWNIFCVSLGPRILILKSIRGQIILNSHWLLKDEEAINWKGGFRNFHWTRGINSRKRYGGLLSEKGSLLGRGKGKGKEGMCEKKISSYVWKGVVHEKDVCKE